MEVKVAQAKAQMSALLDRVEQGEVIYISRRGKRIARLVPERRSTQSAADVMRPIWDLGGLQIGPIAELPLDPAPDPLD